MTSRLFYPTQMRMQFAEIAQILQISTTRTSMATNFSPKLEIVECCSVTKLKVYQKLLWLFLVLLCFMEDVFPNLRISLQILLTIAVSIASCERSFSKLKLILSYSRASMGQDRLSDLALLSVERETLEKTDFDDVIDQFATVKSRKINLL